MKLFNCHDAYPADILCVVRLAQEDDVKALHALPLVSISGSCWTFLGIFGWWSSWFYFGFHGQTTTLCFTMHHGCYSNVEVNALTQDYQSRNTLTNLKKNAERVDYCKSPTFVKSATLVFTHVEYASTMCLWKWCIDPLITVHSA